MKKLIIIMAGLIVIVSNAFTQEKIYMPFFEVINLNSSYRYSTSKLLKVYSDEAGKYVLLLPETKDTIAHPSFDKALSDARQNNASYLLIGEINKLGNVATVSLTLYNTSDGKLYKQVRQKALTDEDIDPVLERLGKGMSTMFTEKKDDIYNITKYEGQELNKIGVNYSFGAKIGGGYSFGNNINHDFPAGFGLMGSYDARDVIFNMTAEMYTSDINMYQISLDIMKTLNSINNSPYINAGLAYGGISIVRQDIQTYNSDDINFKGQGLSLLFGGGYLFGRCSQVGVRVGVSAFLPLYSIDRVVDARYLGSDPKSMYAPGILFNMILTIGGKIK
jgi:hypothetical protein